MFNRKEVRKEFVSKYCHEYTLPSGKRSGYYAFPIKENEINELTKEYDDSEFRKHDDITTISEWRVFIALRKKYGFNYLEAKPYGQRAKWIDVHEETEEPIEEKIENLVENYVDFRIGVFQNVFVNKPQPVDITEEIKEEKNFRKLFDIA